VLEVLAPTTRIRRELPEHRLEGLLERCRGLKPMLSGVVHPCSAEALAGAIEAAEAGLIVPVLFGPEKELRQVAKGAKLDLSGYRIVTSEGPEDSAQKAAMAAGAGEVAALMKGNLHTDVLLHAIMQKEAKLRTGRLLSHCAMMSVPTYARRVVITDVALNIAPDTGQKRDICQNAIGFALALGIEVPKVAVLAAVETVSTKMPASLDGAIFAKMADRRQIVGGIVDGPLDLDAAVDAAAAQIKHISSPRRAGSAIFSPMTKNVAWISRRARMSSTPGVTFGSGPLSKLSVRSNMGAPPIRRRVRRAGSLALSDLILDREGPALH
jgi:phosphate acetyltransferase